MNKKLLVISSILMLVVSLPMIWWCLALINNASMDYEYAGLGCLIMALTYTFSIITSIFGFKFNNKKYLGKIFGYIQLIVSICLVLILKSYLVLVTIPILIITIVYLYGIHYTKEEYVKERKK